MLKQLIIRLAGRLFPKIARRIFGHQLIVLDYPVKSVPRYGHGKPPHPELYKMINRNRTSYRDNLIKFLDFQKYLLNIPLREPDTPHGPCWINEMFSGLDAVALYSLLCLNNPERYFEIGSGWSTKFARRAIFDHSLKTKITSLDPSPRTDVSLVCDDVILKNLEDAELGIFDELESGDILFVDGSHRCFMNSDVTCVFLEILPRLNTGVLVQFHDIMLPYDYPPQWAERYYSEQYLLAVHILAETDKFDIISPNAFINNDPDLNGVLGPIWNETKMHGVNPNGRSFWIKIK
jgi:hypothetical protein